MTQEYESTCEHGNTIRFVVADGPLTKTSVKRIDPPCYKEDE